MPGKAAVVLTAAALSVTVGVLIGIVLIIGSRARQQAVATVPSSTATGQSVPLLSTAGTTAQSSALPAASPSAVPTGNTPRSGTTRASTSTPPPSSKATTRRATTPSRPAPTRNSPAIVPTATRTGIVFTTVTVAPPTSRSIAPTSVSTTPSTAPAPTATTRPAPVGGPTAGGGCPALGDRATAAGGVTVYCQRDFSNGSLAWRAVVEGGGCLSKKMTGTGADGRAYVCRPDRKGLDHWRRA